MLVICGFWGQGPIARIVGEILGAAPEARVHAVCGENDAARRALEAAAAGHTRLAIHGALPTIAPLLAECGSVVTKPGISTLLEAHAARRQLFLLRGMPVAEDHNWDHAIRRFGARPYDPAALAAFVSGADPNQTQAAAEAAQW